MGTRIRLLSSVAVLLALLIVSGCVSTARPGPLMEDVETIGLRGAEAVETDILMGAGELRLLGGSDELLTANFTYNIDAWEPEINYTVEGGRGRLTVAQPDVSIPETTSVRYEWDLQLNDRVPLDVDVTLGAGAGNLDFSGLNIRSLDVQVGAGEGIVILTGDYAHDVEGVIQGGVGSVTVLLSNQVGVRAEVTGGLGSISAEGFNQDGSVYTNDAYGTSDVTVNLDIEGGVGEITLQLVD